MPHSGKSDEEIEAVYAELDNLLLRPGASGFRTVVSGDFNAEVGSGDDEDESDILGPNPIGH